MNLLDEIFAHKRLEVASLKRERPLAAVQEAARQAPPPRDFLAALRGAACLALIAEIKQRSPSRGLLNPDFDPAGLARIYEENGASAISILTDEKYFGGHLDTLQEVACHSRRLPLLRKDFLYDPYQIYEARAAGADAVLLIAAGLERSLLVELHSLSLALDLTPLVEIHTEAEIPAALDCRPVLIGINNRNLQDFTVSIETTLRLVPLLPQGIPIVSESGIHSREDAARVAQAGVSAILVGEAFATAADIPGKVRELAFSQTTPAGDLESTG